MKQSYDPVLKSLHWLMFVLIVIEFTLAWTMPGLRRVTTLPSLVSLHFSFGILIFMLIIFRTYWRATHTVPALPSEMSPALRFVAHAMHYSLYGILLVLPLLGLAYASSHGLTVSFFGMFNLPALFANGSSVGRALGELHGIVATLLVFLIGFHIVAAYYHHLIVKDDILTRMLPEKKTTA
jgi:cytochrome b561